MTKARIIGLLIACIEAPIPWNDAGTTWQAVLHELAFAARQALMSS